MEMFCHLMWFNELPCLTVSARKYTRPSQFICLSSSITTPPPGLSVKIFGLNAAVKRVKHKCHRLLFIEIKSAIIYSNQLKLHNRVMSGRVDQTASQVATAARCSTRPGNQKTGLVVVENGPQTINNWNEQL